MAKRKQMTCNSFVFYGSFYEAISVLPTENQGRIYDAIFQFAFENIEVELEGVDLAVFLLIKPQIEANRTKYENGCKGGAPKGNQNARKKTTDDCFEEDEENNQKQPMVDMENNQWLKSKQPNENDNDNVNDNENDIYASKKENKENYKLKNQARECAYESYQDIIDTMMVEANVQPMLWKFIQHCQLNGKTLTNKKLEDILVYMDMSGYDDKQKIQALKTAINGGYYDIKRGAQ